MGSSLNAGEKKIGAILSRELEPTTPTESNPLTLSRESIKTEAGSTEAIKVKVLNPTGEDWTARYDLYSGFQGCGASDRICYKVDCEDDPDCPAECGEDGHCLWSDGCESGDPREMQDCGPQDGVDILVRCDNELKITEVSNPKMILSNEIQEFTTIFRIGKDVEGRYLCNVKLFGNKVDGSHIAGMTRDITVEVI